MGETICPIVFCADEGYGIYLPAAVQSILENSSADCRYQIIIFDCGISGGIIDAVRRQVQPFSNFSVQLKNIEAWLAKHKAAFRESLYLTKATYGRFAIPELCPEFDKIIYADIDIVFGRDISGLLDTELDGSYIAGAVDSSQECEFFLNDAVRDYRRNILQERDYYKTYINAGLLVFNLKAWREHDLSAKAIEFLTEKRPRLLDQDAINYICKGKIAYLDGSWNCLAYTHDLIGRKPQCCDKGNAAAYRKAADDYLADYKAAGKCLHYNGELKPWHCARAAGADIWWHYAAHTELCGDYVSIYLRGVTPARQWTDSYRFLSLPLWQVKANKKGRKYSLCGMRIAKKAVSGDNEDFYIFGVKLFSRCRAMR